MICNCDCGCTKDISNSPKNFCKLCRPYQNKKKFTDTLIENHFLFAPGKLLFESGKYEEALKKFDLLLKTGHQNLIRRNYKVQTLIKLNRLNDALKFQLHTTTIFDNFHSWEILGLIYDKLEKFDESIEAYDRAIETSPDAKYWFAECLIYLKLKKLKESLFCIEKSLDIVPDDMEYLRTKLMVVEKLNDSSEAKKISKKLKTLLKGIEQSEYEYSLKKIEKKLKKTPNSEKQLLAKVYLLSRLERFDEELVILEKLLSQKPDDPQLLFKKFYTLRGLGKYRDALVILEKLLSQKPDDFKVLSQKAYLLRNMNRYQDALVILEKLLSQKPDDVSSLSQKIYALKDLERYQDALVVLEILLKLKPHSLNILFEKIHVLNNLGNFQEALDIIEEILPMNPDNPKLLSQKVYSLGRLERFDEELVILEKLLSQKPDDPQLLSKKIHVLNNLGNFQEALDIIEEILPMNPDDSQLLSQKVYCFSKLGRIKDQFQILEKLLSQKPGNPQLLSQKAYLLNKTKKYPDALSLIEKLLSQNPDDPQLLSQKSYSLEKLEQFDDLIPFLETQITNTSNLSFAKQLVIVLKKTNKPNLFSYFSLKINRDSHNLGWKYAKLKVLVDQKDFDEAIIYFKENPEFKEHEYFLELIGFCYEKIKLYDEANNYYDKIFIINPDNIFLWIGKANIDMAQENFPNAVINFKKAYDISHYPNIYNAWTFALVQDGKYSEALKLHDERLKSFPTDVKSKSLRLDVMRKMGQVNVCLDEYFKLHVENPENIGILIGIAKTYERMERHLPCLKYLEKALALDYDNETALKWKVIVFTKMREFSKASEIIEIIKKNSGIIVEHDLRASFDELKNEVDVLLRKKSKHPSEEISIFPNEIFDTDLKMEKLFNSMNGYIWIQDGYLDSKIFDYLHYSMHENSTIKEIKLMFSLSWNTIDKISNLSKKRKKFNVQHKQCSLNIACSAEFGKNYHDRFIFSKNGEWNWAGASTVTQSSRSTVSKIQHQKTENKDRNEFERLWGEAIPITEKVKILKMWRTITPYWDTWKKNHNYSEDEANQNYQYILND